MISYDTANEVKSSFDAIYRAPTPHAYFAEMHRLEYAIGEQARRYFKAAARLLRRQLGRRDAVRMLDLGCSYGVGSALVKHGFSFGELAEFFEREARAERRACIEKTRSWIARNGVEDPIACVGADVSEPAVTFAARAGLIEAGIVHDLEADPRLTQDERALVADCNLLISTGTIGYVGERTVSALLSCLGTARAGAHGPCAVVTILRMFAPEMVAATFERFGYRFAPVPGVRLRQRRFDDAREQRETLRLLRERDVDPTGWEDTGYLYADLFAAAPPRDFAALMEALLAARGTAAARGPRTRTSSDLIPS